MVEELNRSDIEEFRESLRRGDAHIRRFFKSDTNHAEIFGDEAIHSIFEAHWERLFGSSLDFVEKAFPIEDLDPTLPVLDLGAGWQYLTRQLEERHLIRVVPMDINYAISTRAHEHTKVDTIVGDGRRSPFKEGSFSAIISWGTARYLLNSEDDSENLRVLKELLRLPIPGGKIVLGDTSRELEHCRQSLDKLNVPYTIERGEVSVFKATSFYFYYNLYAQGAKSHDERFAYYSTVFTPELLAILEESGFADRFCEYITATSEEEGLSPEDILIDLAGFEVKELEALTIKTPENSPLEGP